MPHTERMKGGNGEVPTQVANTGEKLGDPCHTELVHHSDFTIAGRVVY